MKPLSSKLRKYLPSLPESQFRLEAIVESSDDAIITKDLDGTITSWNAAATRIFGYTPDEIIGQSILQLIPPELHEEEAEILNKLRSGERIDHYETVRVAKDGTRIPVSLTVSPIRDEQGVVVGASKVAHDIGDKIRADELRNRLAAIVESSDDAIASKDLNGIITSWNAAAERMFGWRAEEIVGRSVLTLIPKELQHEEPEILRKLRSGERIDHYETQRIHKDGRVLDVSLTVSPVRDSHGNVIGASKIARDITERKRLQSALIESEKLAATGRMAATIAHEINNPLEAMMNLTFILATNASLDEDTRHLASMLLEQTARASEIARQTLSFYRERTNPAATNLCELLDGVLSLNHKRLERKHIRIRREYSETPEVFGYKSELRQVFSNLLLNAMDAVSDHGEICLRVSNDPSSNGLGRRVRVSVLDNGNGIPANIRRKLFQPFFTTKKAGGNGLGLWVSKGIVEKHGGKIKMKTSAGPTSSGSVFTVFLPIDGVVPEKPSAE